MFNTLHLTIIPHSSSRKLIREVESDGELARCRRHRSQQNEVVRRGLSARVMFERSDVGSHVDVSMKDLLGRRSRKHDGSEVGVWSGECKGQQELGAGTKRTMQRGVGAE